MADVQATRQSRSLTPLLEGIVEEAERQRIWAPWLIEDIPVGAGCSDNDFAPPSHRQHRSSENRKRHDKEGKDDDLWLATLCSTAHPTTSRAPPTP
eukprot:1888880-Pyramimonas_sp.AAC.1